MKSNFEIYCLVCGKGKGRAFKAFNHDKCAKVLQEKKNGAKKRVSTRRMTDKAINFLAKVGA